MVVSPLILTAPLEVWNVPIEADASKLPDVWVYPVINSRAPRLVNRETPLVKSEPSERLRFATFEPLEFSTVRVLVDPWVKSKVVEPPENGTLVSAMVMLLKVFAPVNVCGVSRSATVIVPAEKEAVVEPPVIRLSGPAPITEKFWPSVSVPVVHVG